MLAKKKLTQLLTRVWMPIAFGLLALTAKSVAQEPIRLHPENGHYFLFRGQPTTLIGSSEHYGAVINLDFDYVPYLDAAAASGLNVVRVFPGTYRETPGSFNIADNTLAPPLARTLLPWKRTATGGAGDGGNKFDLNQWEPAYFSRLQAFVTAASQRGIVVEISFFCPFYDDALWNISPMKSTNHINGAGAGGRVNCFQPNNDLLSYQTSLVGKFATELNGFDNVYYEIINEPYNGGVSSAWQDQIITALVAAESQLPQRHMIAQNVANYDAPISNPNPAVSIFNFHYAQPNAALRNFGLNRAIGDDETGFAGTADFAYRRESWEFMLSGGGLINHLDFSFTTTSEDGHSTASAPGGGGPGIRKQLGVLRKFMEDMPLLTLAPQTSFVTGGVPEGGSVKVIGAPGTAYGLYLRGGTQANLTVNLPAGTYHGEWIDPVSGLTLKTEDFTHPNGNRTLVTPGYSQDIALRLGRPSLRSLTLNSTPQQAVEIAVNPADSNGNTNGTAGFTRSYWDGTIVTLTAPSSSAAGSFVNWLKDGAVYSTSATTNLRIDGSHTLTAVYSNIPTDSQLIVNGSFESGLAGWTSSGNLMIQSSTPYAATDGMHLVGFNGVNSTPNGVLSQTFSTEPGVTYTLEFDAGVLAYNTAQQKTQVTVAGSGNVLSKTITLTGNGDGSNQWVPQLFTFIANSTTTTLSFSDVSATTNGLDHLLDHVRVTGASATSPGAPLPPATLSGAPGSSQIGINATALGTYFLERSADLKTWTRLQGTVVTEPTTLEFPDGGPSGTRMFYRIAFEAAAGG